MLGRATLTNAELKQLQERARSVARSRGHAEYADDFAQEAVLALLGGRKASLDQLLVDFLRKEHGRTGTRRCAARYASASLDAPTGAGAEGRPYSDCLAAPRGDPEPLGGDWRSRVALSGHEAIVAELVLDDELDQETIGALLGVTAARISQIYKGVKRAVAGAAVLEEHLDTYRDDREASLLFVRWIRL